MRDTEVRQVQEAAAEVGKVLDQEYAPKLAFTIITKKVRFLLFRILLMCYSQVNMRVFKKVGPVDLKNPDPGTVVVSLLDVFME